MSDTPDPLWLRTGLHRPSLGGSRVSDLRALEAAREFAEQHGTNEEDRYRIIDEERELRFYKFMRSFFVWAFLLVPLISAAFWWIVRQFMAA